MAETLAEKLVGGRAGKKVTAGELVLVDIDLIFIHDLSGPITLTQIPLPALQARASKGEIIIKRETTMSTRPLLKYVPTVISENSVPALRMAEASNVT